MGTNNTKLGNETFLCLDNDSDSESSLSDLDEYDFDDLVEIRNFSYLYENNYNSPNSNDVNNLNIDSNIVANSNETDEFDESDSNESDESENFNRSNISLVAIAEFNSNNTNNVSNGVDVFTQINEDDLSDLEEYENFHIWYTNSSIYNRYVNNYFLTIIRDDDISTNNNYDNELFV